ncbi:transglutaminase TgpA family protein [Propionivibrio limicola]|uniref:transglutaminase TgpA family protein n=1 Tax=Propionivibrio limicola TaxID=167645 RepID=UPI001291C1AE|nr:DUF3488 and transglutaminase-like domain-containing protein [Propionivibrio limicola]
MAISLFRTGRKLKTSPSAPLLEHGTLPWLLAVALATAGPHVSHLPPWLSLLAGLLLVWRALIWQRNGRLPPRWLLAGLVIAGSAGIAFQFRTLFGREAGVAMLVFFMALKPMEMKAQRDAFVVIMLGFFLLVTHYLYSQSIATGVWLLGTATLLTATLIRLSGGAQPVRAIVKYAGLLVAQSLPLMLVLFLLFPRVSGPLWGLPLDAHAGLTGLSDSMSPGSLSNLIQSGAIAFRAQFSGQPPEQSRLYWRGPAFSLYDGKTWRPDPPPAPNPRSATQPIIEARATPISYSITLEPHNQRWLLALDLPVALPENSTLAPTFEALAREPVRSRARFAFRSSPDHVANRSEDSAMLRQALRLPPGLNPRTRTLAAEWKQALASPEQISAAALRFFREEQFFYTLRPPLLGQHAVDEFLFATRRGFCEHYASAYVVLMRAAGVPARVVVGYQGGEINPVDGYLTVRQSDAHAWAEIWVENKGWLRVDPTAAVAPSRVERGIGASLGADEPLPALVRLDAGWLQTLRHRWEAADNAWNQWVLGYNPQRQRELLSRLGLANADWAKMIAALAALGGVCLLLVAFWTLYQAPGTPAEVRAWQRFCRRLERFGIRRAAWEGPFDFAARVVREHPDLGPLTNEAAQAFADLRYGAGRPEQLKQLEACSRRIKSIPASRRERA